MMRRAVNTQAVIALVILALLGLTTTKAQDAPTLTYDPGVVAGTYGQQTKETFAVDEVTAMSGATVTSSSLIPAGSYVTGVTIYVTTLIEGPTTFTIGDGSDADRWGTGIALAAGTTTSIADFTANGFGQFTTANDIVLTATGSNFTAGAVRIVVHYTTLTAAGS